MITISLQFLTIFRVPVFGARESLAFTLTTPVASDMAMLLDDQPDCVCTRILYSVTTTLMTRMLRPVPAVFRDVQVLPPG